MFLDEDRLHGVVMRADAAANSRRWRLAIARAWREIRDNPYMHWDGRSLLVLSSSGELYAVGLACQCKSYRNGRKPCWHRAAARLLLRYFESSGAGEHARHQRN